LRRENLKSQDPLSGILKKQKAKGQRRTKVKGLKGDFDKAEKEKP